MKSLLAVFVGLFAVVSANAYYSAQGNDPNLGSFDTEFKVAVKSETATYSDAISRGHALYYSENELTGLYKVSRYFSGNGMAAAAVPYQGCIAARAVETGDVGGFACVTKGYVDYARYDATNPIAKGTYLCVGTAATVKGVLIACGTASPSKFVSLETKASGSGSDLKVRVLSE